jgi:hypothetical protein
MFAAILVACSVKADRLGARSFYLLGFGVRPEWNISFRFVILCVSLLVSQISGLVTVTGRNNFRFLLVEDEALWCEGLF